MNLLDQDSVVQNIDSEFQNLQIINKDQEFWIDQQPEIKQHNPQIENDEKQPLDSQEVWQDHIQNNKKPKPQFQATVYKGISEQDFALHDHDRVGLITFTHRFNENYFVYRYTIEGNIFVEFVSEEDAKFGNLPHENAEILMHIKLIDSMLFKGKKFFYIEPQKITSLEQQSLDCKKLQKKLFKNLKAKQNDKSLAHKLQVGDQIRFGLQNFRIFEIQTQSMIFRQHNKHDKIDNQIFLQKQLSEGTCKICLSSDNQRQNPLLDPCQCKGSCQYVHLHCLRTWLDSNLEKESDPLVDTYKWIKFQCQICKTCYPLKINYKGVVLKLAVYTIPQNPYVIFERMRPGSRKQIIIVKDAKIPAIVGRTINSDFKIGLNSVSRRHASIEFKQGSFYVRDLDSKYGTLVRIKDPIRIEGKLKVQVGDVLIRFDLVMKKFGKEFVWKYN